jgi:hypothetical protein
MSSNEMQAELGTAIAQLQVIQRHILEVFEWASLPGMITDEARSRNAMALELARVQLPILEGHLCKASQMVTGEKPPSYLTNSDLC